MTNCFRYASAVLVVEVTFFARDGEKESDEFAAPAPGALAAKAAEEVGVAKTVLEVRVDDLAAAVALATKSYFFAR